MPLRRATEVGPRFFGPGKVILLGEHSVVYGAAAIAGPLSRGIVAWAGPSSRCELAGLRGLSGEQKSTLQRAFARVAEAVGRPKVSVKLASDLPISMGLGSSGALSVAVVRCLLAAAGIPERSDTVQSLAFEMEREFHGTPSGIDHSTSALGRLIQFQNGEVRALKAKKDLPVVVGILGERPPTKQTVGALRSRQALWPLRYQGDFSDMGQLAQEGIVAIEKGDLASLGDLMNLNQGLLNALQLSSPKIETGVAALREAGALGAKLTGAGGDGGAILGLFPSVRSATAWVESAPRGMFQDLFVNRMKGAA